MSTNHDVWDAVAQTDGTPANSFEFLLRKKNPTSGTFEQSADVTAVAPAFTAKNRNRETYAAKGVDSMSKYGETLVLTFDVEAIRDANGAFQPWLQDLLDASKTTGAANRRTMQAFDALGADYAFQSDFAIQVGRTNTGWDDASFFTITATQYGKTTWIANPVLVGNVPTLSNLSAAHAAVGATVTIEGHNLDNPTAIKFGGTNGTAVTTVIPGRVVSAVVPAGSGSKPITVVTAVGTSDPIPFVVD